MKKKILCLLIIILSAGNLVFSQTNPEITSSELKAHVYFLASDSLKGRKPGTPESGIAAAYICNNFRNDKLKLLDADGFQSFDLVTDMKAGTNNSFLFNGFTGKINEDFIPLSFSANARLQAEIVFAGFGFDVDFDSISLHDYQNVDVKGKWVMVLRGEPDPDNSNSPFVNVSQERSKVLTAKDKGAAGVIFVTGMEMNDKDRLIPLTYDMTASDAGISVINITRKVADFLLKSTQKSIEEIEKELIKSKTSGSFYLPVTVDASTEVIPVKAKAQNVVALLEGSDPVLKNEYIVVGAHYDHLGFGGKNSGSRMPDTVAIHNGADDNASGVAAVLELAQKLASEHTNLKRSILFVTFDAEEMGMIGSKYFINHPPVARNEIKAMINLDMIGRLKPDSKVISIGGTGTATELDSILTMVSADRIFTVSRSPEGYGPSDHAAFYSENIPVLFFTTGAHEDYHTPMDKAGKIDYDSEAEIAKMADQLIFILATMNKPLTFKEAGPKAQPESGRRLKVTLGIVPDFASTDKNGLGVDGVRKDGPADRGGIKKGDLIVAMNGQPVTNIYDYMSRLQKLKHGQTVIVEVIRSGKKEVLLIQL